MSLSMPHAVQSIPGLGNYSYDADGNQTGTPGAAGQVARTVTWTSFDMPNLISANGGSIQSDFIYGPEHQRSLQWLGPAGSNGAIAYAGSMEADVNGSTGVTTLKTYWPMGIGLEIDTFNQGSTSANPSSATQLYWTHTDRLGSVIALSDQNGSLNQSAQAFDAWGARRNTDGTTLTTGYNANNSIDNKGYTGQEMLDQLGMVHMNGRVYDPVIARFASADPLVQAPYNSQSLNRYSYVWNQPLDRDDPSGFDNLDENAVNNCPCDFGGTPDAGVPSTTTLGTTLDDQGQFIPQITTTATKDNASSSITSDASNDSNNGGNSGWASFGALLGLGSSGNSGPTGGGNQSGSHNSSGSWNGKSGQGPNIRGSAAVKIVEADLRSQGFQILGEQLRATTERLNYGRRYDLVVRNPLNKLVFGVEVKSTIVGAFKLDPKQVAFDVATVRDGADVILSNRTVLPIQGVMYRGVDWTGSNAAAVYSTLNLWIELKSAGITSDTHNPPFP